MKTLRTMTAALVAIGSLTLLAGCGDEEDEAKELTVQTRTGPVVLRYLDIEPGKGATIKKGDTVLFHYTGWTNGNKIDSSYDKGKPARMEIGWTPGATGLVGWHEGIVGMKVGGKRKLFIPPELGYKDQGSPDGRVKPNAKMVYEIVIVRIAAEDEDIDLLGDR
jgi:peptidylprolyl isomerase